MILMSSPLPASLRAEFDARYRDRKGRYRCARCRIKYPRTHIHIDHIKPEVDHPELKHRLDNLQPLCAPPGGGGCHRAKTAKEARHRRRRPWWWRFPRIVAATLPMLIVAAVGAGMMRWGYLYATRGPRAAERFYEHATTLGTQVLATVALLLLAWLLARFWPRPAKSQATVSDTYALENRIVGAARDAMGQRGEIKVVKMEIR